MNGRARIAGVLVFLAALSLPASASAFKFETGDRWETERVTYWVGNKSLRTPLARAAKAWNGLGLNVRFARVNRRKDALVRIRLDGNHCVGGVTQVIGISQTSTVPGQASQLDYIARAQVLIARGCSTPIATFIATHELGHVLGLDHERKKCALMNPSGDQTGTSQQCRNASEELRATLIKPDDERGIRKLYKKPLASPRPSGYDEDIPF